MNTVDRMPPIPDAEMTTAQRGAVADFKETRHTTDFSGPFISLLRSPELLRRLQRVGQYLRYESALPPRLSEFAILITARHWRQEYEWGIHSTIASEVGLDTAIIKAIAEGQRPSEMANDEEVLYDFCLELLQDQRTSDATYTRTVDLFEEKGVVDTIAILGYYSLLAMLMNTAGTSPSDSFEQAAER